jgi:sarcosine oxidase subunit beta
MTPASVVIVGGGVIGVSIAFHLAEAGVEDIVLVERGELGSGSTSKGAGGVRALFSDELNVRLALRSLDAWAAFGERPGHGFQLAPAIGEIARDLYLRRERNVI